MDQALAGVAGHWGVRSSACRLPPPTPALPLKGRGGRTRPSPSPLEGEGRGEGWASGTRHDLLVRRRHFLHPGGIVQLAVDQHVTRVLQDFLRALDIAAGNLLL